MARMEQVEHPVGKYDRPRLAGTPARASASGRTFPAVLVMWPCGDDPKSTLSTGGATKVVAITMSRIAPNTASLRMPDAPPDVGKDETYLAPRTMPTPTTMRRKLTQGAAQPAATLPGSPGP